LLADELPDHIIEFVCTKQSELAVQLISRSKYPVTHDSDNSLVRLICSKNPDLVINDILDTSIEYVSALKGTGAKVINFEDLGEGAYVADATINALYSHDLKSPFEYCGPKYLCLRNEFVWAPKRNEFSRRIQNVLLVFGGTDPNNLSARCLNLLMPLAIKNSFSVTLIVGPGYPNYRKKKLNELGDHDSVTIISDTCRMSDHMSRADLAISSGGRTAYELVSMRVPSIIVCQNEREEKHIFDAEDFGLIDLGLASDLPDQKFVEEVERLIDEPGVREEMFEVQKKLDLTVGKKRVLKILRDVLTGADVKSHDE